MVDLASADASEPTSGADGARAASSPPAPHDPQTVGESDGSLDRLTLPARPFRVMAVVAAAMASVLTGWQTTRAVDGQDWSRDLAVGALLAAVVAGVGILIWTWVVVENSRRLLLPARSEHPPVPSAVVLAWVAPMIVAAGAAGAVVFLQARLHDSPTGDTSPVPLAVATLALVATLLMAYRPLFMLSSTTRRLGGGSVELSHLFWAPVALLVVGSGSLLVLRGGGAYGEDFEGLAPGWALGAVAIPPTVIVLMLAWRGGRAVEDAVDAAFVRRSGAITAMVTVRRRSRLAQLLGLDPGPQLVRDLTKEVRLIPGQRLVRLAMMTALAALALLSIVGALVMFLFWREVVDGRALQAQQTRAWDALEALQGLERVVGFGLLGVAAVWAFLNVANARLASGRRRNPFLAALAIPAAAYGIWRIADALQDDERVAVVVGGFALQAVVLFVPFFLLERAATVVVARRQPLRTSYGLGVILLIQVQGLVGLSTLDTAATTDQFGRIAGYLALTALVEVLAIVTISEASHLIADAAEHMADHHNALVEQRVAREGQARARRGLTASPIPGEAPEHAGVAPVGSAGVGSPVVIAAAAPPADPSGAL